MDLKTWICRQPVERGLEGRLISFGRRYWSHEFWFANILEGRDDEYPAPYIPHVVRLLKKFRAQGGRFQHPELFAHLFTKPGMQATILQFDQGKRADRPKSMNEIWTPIYASLLGIEIPAEMSDLDTRRSSKVVRLHAHRPGGDRLKA